jgi:acyl carrier protein
MTPSDIADAVRRAIEDIAPDADASALDADLHDDLGLDSMDLLNLAAAVSERTAVDIDDRDYGQLTTIRRLVDYVCARAAVPNSS